MEPTASLLPVDLFKAYESETQAIFTTQALGLGVLQTTEALSEWHKAQDPLGETLQLDSLLATAERNPLKLFRLAESYKARTRMFRSAGYLCVIRTVMPECIVEASEEEYEEFEAIRAECEKYLHQEYPGDDDVAMTLQDMALTVNILRESREDSLSVDQLILGAHLIYDAVTDAVDMADMSTELKQAVTQKDAILIAIIRQKLSMRLPDIVASGDLNTAFDVAQTIMMIESLQLNMLDNPERINNSKKEKILSRLEQLRLTIETILPYVDPENRSQMGKLYEMVWLYDAHALKVALKEHSVAILPSHRAKDEAKIGRPKRKRNIDITFMGGFKDPKILKIQLKAAQKNRARAFKEKHPSVYISPRGEDFNAQYLEGIESHFDNLFLAAKKEDRRLAEQTVMPTVLDSFRAYKTTRITTLDASDGVVEFVNQNPYLSPALKMILARNAASDKVARANRETRRRLTRAQRSSRID